MKNRILNKIFEEIFTDEGMSWILICVQYLIIGLWLIFGY